MKSSADSLGPHQREPPLAAFATRDLRLPVRYAPAGAIRRAFSGSSGGSHSPDVGGHPMPAVFHPGSAALTPRIEYRQELPLLRGFCDVTILRQTALRDTLAPIAILPFPFLVVGQGVPIPPPSRQYGLSFSQPASETLKSSARGSRATVIPSGGISSCSPR